MWFKKKHPQPRSFQVGDEVWVNTFVKSYRGKVVGFAPPDIMQTSERVIVEIYGNHIPVSPSLLSKKEA